MQRLQKKFAEWRKAERPRFFLWLPVWLGAGMAAYYALPFEPSRLLYASPVALLGFLFVKNRLPTLVALLLLALLLALNGAAYAKWRTGEMQVVMLDAPLSMRMVEGNVAALEHIEKGLRITLSDLAIERLAPEKTPTRIRIAYRGKTLPELALGERIRLRTALLPPSGPAMPGGFDFARYFFFRQIGAVGYAIPPITSIDPGEAHGFWLFWSEARDRLTASIQRTLPGTEGAIAAGLITGDDSAIPESVHEELRAANLLHIIAISGAHMVVIGGIVFVVLRALLVLIPGFGLRPLVKTLTAALTLVAISLYLAITGFEISATRSYVMLALVLLAILFHREPKPMRSIALAALLMLALDPSDITEPGFQLSFAATLALIAAFENIFDETLQERGPIATLWRIVWFLLLTTIVAQAATTTIILFHFNNLSLYGIFSNLILTPVVTLLIMPMVACYFVLLPFGLDPIALHILSYGIKAMLWVAHEVSGWPHALTYTRGPTALGMALAMLGLCWVCLWQTRTRRYGVIAILLGTATLFTVTPPDIFVSPRAAQVAMRTEKGHVLLRGRADGLFPTLWANGSGLKTLTELRDAEPLKEAECIKGACDIRAPMPIHLSFTVPDIKKGCPNANLWISGYYLYPEERASCPSAMRYLDRADFDRNGSYWGWFEGEGIRWQSSRELQGSRPWAVKPIPSPAPRYGSPHANGTRGGTPHTRSASSAR